MCESRRHITNMPLSDNDISVGKWVKPEQKLLCSLVSTYHWQVGQVSYSSCSRENVLHFKTLPTGVCVPNPRILYHLLMEEKKMWGVAGEHSVSCMSIRTKSQAPVVSYLSHYLSFSIFVYLNSWWLFEWASIWEPNIFVTAQTIFHMT